MNTKNKKHTVVYVLTGPSGEVFPSTAREDKRQCWVLGFLVVADKLGEAWWTKYWKRWEPSIRAAKRAGYRIERARLVLESKSRKPPRAAKPRAKRPARA